MVEVGVWKNYQEIEDNLTLDELMLTLKALNKKNHEEFKRLAAVQGIEVDDIPDYSEESDKPLPPEIAAMEEEFNRKKKERLEKGEKVDDWAGIQIGFAADGFDQLI